MAAESMWLWIVKKAGCEVVTSNWEAQSCFGGAWSASWQGTSPKGWGIADKGRSGNRQRLQRSDEQRLLLNEIPPFVHAR